MRYQNIRRILLANRDDSQTTKLVACARGWPFSVGAPVDVVVVTPADVARYKDSHALIIKPALREGRVVYETA